MFLYSRIRGKGLRIQPWLSHVTVLLFEPILPLIHSLVGKWDCWSHVGNLTHRQSGRNLQQQIGVRYRIPASQEYRIVQIWLSSCLSFSLSCWAFLVAQNICCGSRPPSDSVHPQSGISLQLQFATADGEFHEISWAPLDCICGIPSKLESLRPYLLSDHACLARTFLPLHGFCTSFSQCVSCEFVSASLL